LEAIFYCYFAEGRANTTKSSIVAGRKRGGREINEYYCETKNNWSWGMLSGDQSGITLPQRLHQPMK
jgi:hypothetical protein